MEVLPSIEDLRSWADRLEEVQDRLAPYFERAEPRQRAMAYIRGLLSTTERKNGWQLAEVAGEATPDGMQRLLNTAKWDADQVRNDLQAYILTHLADPEAVLRSEEHTSELQSRSDLVCRLLLEIKRQSTCTVRTCHAAPGPVSLLDAPKRMR